MCSENLNKAYTSGENSNQKSLNDSILKSKAMYQNSNGKNAKKKTVHVSPLQLDHFENDENYSLISNSGNKDTTVYTSNRHAIKPRRIFG